MRISTINLQGMLTNLVRPNWTALVFSDSLDQIRNPCEVHICKTITSCENGATEKLQQNALESVPSGDSGKDASRSLQTISTRGITGRAVDYKPRGLVFDAALLQYFFANSGSCFLLKFLSFPVRSTVQRDGESEKK